MVDILRLPDDYVIKTEEEIIGDAAVRFNLVGRKLEVYLKAQNVKPKFVMLRWNYKTEEPVDVMGDRWERAYGDMSWKHLDGERFMPWYFLASNGKETTGCGVMVRPNSFVSFEYDASGVSAWFDVRCGAMGVELNGRELHIGTVVCEHYTDMTTIEAATNFCSVMCEDPILPKFPVYGGNNWYYAYGNSSAEEIIEDTKLQVELSEGIENRPFMVIDDCWQKISVSGPWEPNEKFGDMKELCSKMKSMGVRTGIWVRFLENLGDFVKDEWKIVKNGHPTQLDPSVPEVLELVKTDIKKIKDWGFELIKHDYSTCDMFGDWGIFLNGTITKQEDWSFKDRSKTSAEIVLQFYRTIREAAGDTLIIGCNTISHLCAGLVEINRIGDDTSGRYWNRTRILGVNTLAFRMCQNRTFYMADADCVGVLENRIDWKMNRKWLDLLAKSGTPLFISCPNGVLTDEQKEEFKAAYRLAAKQENFAVPVDWMYNTIPAVWMIDGERVEYDWVEDNYPSLLSGPTAEM